jgi:hypothetical protein
MNSNNIFKRLKDHVFQDKSVTDMKNCLEKLNNDCDNDEARINHIIDSKNIINNNLFHCDETYERNDNVHNDVEFFNKLSTKTTSIFDSINNCSTYGGKYVSQHIYKNPLCDIKILRSRNECLHDIEHKYNTNKEETNQLLDIMNKNEKHITWLLEEKDETIKDLYSLVFFRLKGLKPLNNVGSALTTYNIYRMLVSPLFGMVAPIVYFIIPYIIVLYKFKMYIPFTTYIKTMFYSVFNSSETLLGNNKFFKYVRIISYVFSAVFY